jgi:hypothetical protein
LFLKACSALITKIIVLVKYWIPVLLQDFDQLLFSWVGDLGVVVFLKNDVFDIGTLLKSDLCSVVIPC